MADATKIDRAFLASEVRRVMAADMEPATVTYDGASFSARTQPFDATNEVLQAGLSGRVRFIVTYLRADVEEGKEPGLDDLVEVLLPNEETALELRVVRAVFDSLNLAGKLYVGDKYQRAP